MGWVEGVQMGELQKGGGGGEKREKERNCLGKGKLFVYGKFLLLPLHYHCHCLVRAHARLHCLTPRQPKELVIIGQ